VHHPVPPAAAPRSRGVSTARTVLHLLSLLAEAPDGLRADEVATALGKSASTAYNLLDTLCQEGFAAHAADGTYNLIGEATGFVPATRGREVSTGLAGILDELFARTHKRVYLAAAHSGQVVIPLARGRQGMPRIPGLGARIGENAHALALGKVALSLLDDSVLDRYMARGLRAYTPTTITAPDVLRAQLQDIRDGAIAYDVEEFGADFCCLASPVRNARGQTVAALGISMSARCFELERETLSEDLREVAARAAEILGSPAVPAISEDRVVLERPTRPDLGSGSTAVTTTSTYGEEASP
jgi:DNA-binding IclR family transcriptional regulator